MSNTENYDRLSSRKPTKGLEPGMHSKPARAKNEALSDSLARYVRRSACAAAAGLGVFGLSTHSSEAAITAVDAPEFLQKSLVGNPYEPAPIEQLNHPGSFPFSSTGWATRGFDYNYNGNYPSWAAFGIDIDFNGTGDVNFFRGKNYHGYIIGNSFLVGYYGGSVMSSGQVDLLSNDADNPDADSSPNVNPPGVLLQGFNAGEMIGDGNDTAVTDKGIMRAAGYVGDWDGVDDNRDNLYETGNPGNPSYVGFQIRGLSTGTGTGFGWIEVILREGTHTPNSQGLPASGPSHPELQIMRWAYTDDGSAIAAGDIGLIIDPDFDDDNDVDGADFLLWQRGFGSSGATHLDGDSNGDGIVDSDDLANWKTAFGTISPASLHRIPEPTTLGLLAAGAGGLALRRRRSKEK